MSPTLAARCLVCLMLGLLASRASGQDAGLADPPPAATDDPQGRLATLEQEVACLRSRLATPSVCTSPNGPECTASCVARSGRIYAGYEFVFAKPHLKESFDATRFDLVTRALTLVPFSFDYDVTPRAWLGLETATGLGVRARYWQYDHQSRPLSLVSGPTTVVGTQSVTVIIPDSLTSTAAGQVLRNVTDLEVQTLDIEGTQSLAIGRVDVLASAGFRYAKLEQDFSSVLSDDGAVLGQLAWVRRFEGFGLTAGAELRRPLGCTGLSFFGRGEGALLFGTKDLLRRDLAATAAVVSLNSDDEVVGIGELELGIEWSRRLSIGDFFLRGTYQGQLWADGGAPTLTFLGFEGFGLALGITR